MILGRWLLDRDGNPILRAIYERHYSSYRYRDGRKVVQFVGPGEHIVLTTSDYSALFVWRKFIDRSGQTGVNCAVFRNESSYLSSELIMEAETWARERWPGERFYTYINSKRIKSKNPGYCFLKAGWKRVGVTKKGLLILAKES